ncbi:MAG: amidohydrolase family protein [Bacteroidetes bacterium]|nr:amidohydrolase family protein [Bacteroidota bacterium]
MKNILKILTVLTVFISAGCNNSNQKISSDDADAIYFGGDIITMAGDSAAYTEAIAVKGGKIIFTGKKTDAEKLKGDSTIMKDLKGKTLLPGFLDGHSHYINSLQVASQCRLYAPPSGPGKDVESIISELKKFAAERNIPKGEMIMGYGYDDTVMPDGLLLNRDDLDKAFPDNPVRIDHVSMHGCVLNSLGLKKYGISAETKTPPGGVIVRKPGTQEPYGLIMETAFMPVIEKIEPMTQQQEIDFTREGQLLYAEAGITTAQEGATHLQQFETIKRASDAGANVIDVIAYPFITEVDKILAVYPLSEWGKYKNRFKVGGVKITLDGSPQGRTALFTTPYLTGGPAGEKNWYGEPTFPPEFANDAFKKVYDMNVPLNVHCNGDGSIDLFLKAYEYARNGDYSKPWNVTTIHTQFLRKDHIPKFVEYKVRPSFYTLHTYYFAEAHIANRGKEQAMYISPMRDAINAGLHPTNHTDFVVAPLDQMMMLYSAVNRISRAGDEIGPDQRITPYEGLEAMTKWAAEQYEELDLKGTLEVGKLADLVILDRNPLKVKPNEIKDIKVLETIKEGNTIFPVPTGGFKSIKVSDATKTHSWTARACDMAGVNQAAYKVWTLISLNGAKIESQNPPEMRFKDGKLSIFGSINSMTANCALVDNTVILDSVVSTKKTGDPKEMEFEKGLAKTMDTVDAFTVSGSELTLFSGGNAVAEFRTVSR